MPQRRISSPSPGGSSSCQSSRYLLALHKLCLCAHGWTTKRTHVLTHAAGTLMHRFLDDPSQGGLGLRRCQWQTNSLNMKSQAAAKRLGYVHEGNLRAQRVLAKGREGARSEWLYEFQQINLMFRAVR